MNFDLSDAVYGQATIRKRSNEELESPRLFTDLSKWISVVRQSGMRHASRFALLVVRARLMRRADRKWETRLGLNLGENVSLESLDITSVNKRHGFSYIPSPGLAARTLLANVPGDLSRCCFIDVGSGEGRVLLVAAEFPFQEVVGVEFAKELHETAVANIAKAFPADAQNGRVRSVHCDAVQFEVPRGDSVFYFHNPFGEEVFSKVLKNIERTHQEYRKKIYVLYQQAIEALETDRNNNVSLLRSAPFLIERKVRFNTPWDRFLLGSYDLRIFQSRVPTQGREVFPK